MADIGGINLSATGFSDTVRIAILRDVIKMLRADAVYALPESVIPLGPDAGGGNTFGRKLTAWTDIPAANGGTGSVLTEGTPPSPRKLAEDSMTVTVQEVGDYIPVFSQAAYQYGTAKAVSVAVDKVARMQFLLWDELAKSVYNAGTTDVFGGSASSTATLVAGNTLSTNIVDELVTQARENDLQPFSDGLYRIIGGPRGFKALMTEASTDGGGFVNGANFGTVGDLTLGVIGNYHGARFISAGSRALKTADQVGPTIPAAADAAIASTDVITTTSAHGLIAGNKVRVVTITGGAGLAAATNYFVVAPVGTTTFKVSATLNGAAINITTDSSAIALASVNDVFKSILVGKGSIALSDPASVENIFQPGGGPSDPLRQTIATVGFKGFIGGALVSLANFSDGAGSLSSDVKRSLTFETVGL